MSEKRRGLGRGLGALIPTGLDTPRSTGDRPVDVFFPDNRKTEAAAADAATAVSASVDAATAVPDVSATAGATAVPTVPGDVVPVPGDGVSTGDAAGHGAEATAGEGSAAAPAAPSGPSSDWVAADVDGLVPVPGARFAELPVGSIRPNPRQPRQVFDEDALGELVGSIREVGVLQPVVVRAVDDGYELIMGERRWRATQEAGLTTIPAIIRDTEDSDLLRDALLENLHRSQLNPLEEAAAYQQLLDDFGCTHEQLATRIHRSRPQISNTLRLLRLPPLVQRRVAAGVLSAGHARALLGLSDGAAIERLAQRIVSEGLSVRAVEEIVSLGGDESAPTRRPRARAGIRNEALDELATRLSDRFETRVKVDLGKTRGKLTVEFASVQDLNRILASLAPEDPGVLRT
ncbi:ParB/RepB/Spo0J family partition protein [Cellulomonas sp. zg-ZUI199]|uniref:ParB/RepB/Spo0J family partition protein n=1 Tax=Cellulomonas wangleii TaxID=2816956 RepID=A0ABX8D4P0_9CELL|nr:MULTISPECIES: ParB/RepB/Spo0J family partition protein [Cellulomonas]MBO0898613.1 ParB/RepB/Spo0J family partition protein [Cellulomonas sp. zg-ZUI22]MBO0924385.1 ParB/RepB/Spo0J family partition protein [Cellulomonas wangleii]QVI62384.1 ParB/RepB/Spo0J family partition protein [Cellulomonas wangleii]